MNDFICAHLWIAKTQMMNEVQKNKVVVILIVIIVVLSIGTFNSCSIVYRGKVARDKETIARFEMEEKINNVWRQQLAALKKELEEERALHAETKKNLVQEQIANQALKEEVARISVLN